MPISINFKSLHINKIFFLRPHSENDAMHQNRLFHPSTTPCPQNINFCNHSTN